jgi:hypothetical protein
MTVHAALPPSAIARWLACPGSAAAERAVERRIETSYSREGTWAHSVYAASLLTGWPSHMIVPDADPDLIKALEIAIEATRTIIRGQPFLVEQRLPALQDEPDVWGTSDVVVLDYARRVTMIIDLKFGRGVLVEADMPQLATYGLLAVAKYGLSHRGLDAWIVQPRAEHSNGIARRQHYTADDLTAFAQVMRAAAAATRQPSAPRHAGSHCVFCAVRSNCETRLRHEMAGFGADIDLTLVGEDIADGY